MNKEKILQQLREYQPNPKRDRIVMRLASIPFFLAGIGLMILASWMWFHFFFGEPFKSCGGYFILAIVSFFALAFGIGGSLMFCVAWFDKEKPKSPAEESQSAPSQVADEAKTIATENFSGIQELPGPPPRSLPPLPTRSIIVLAIVYAELAVAAFVLGYLMLTPLDSPVYHSVMRRIVAGLGLAIFSVPFWYVAKLTPRSRRFSRLYKHGQAVRGAITGKRAEEEQRYTRYVFEYVYEAPSGNKFTGECAISSKEHWDLIAVGEMVTVLVDPRRESESMMYSSPVRSSP